VRKVFGWVLLFLGAFLLVVCVLSLTWLPDAVRKTPLNVDTDTYLTGEADKINTATSELERHPVAYYSSTRVDADKSTDNVVVFVNTKCINIDENDPPLCLDESDDRLITNSIDVFATDRVTALSVENDDFLPPDSVQHEGLVNKWPFGVEKKTYPYWDGTLGRAVDAEYAGTRDFDGLETYEFDVSIPDTEAEILADTMGTYSGDQKIWVDPVTGSIIDQEGGQVLTLEDGTVILDINVAYTDDTVQANVDDAKSNGRLIGLVDTTVPIVSGLLGLVCLVGGFLLLRRSNRQDDESLSPPDAEMVGSDA
jgi:Porin PorA